MANNLRYLLEHFCLDGQKIDISSQLDEENANNIEKINTQTVPGINARIDEIKDNDIPSINSRIDSIKNTDIPSINQKINTINNTTIPSVQENVNAVNEKADRINESVAKNTRDIGTLSDNVTMQGNAINSINTEKIPSVENNVEVVAHETQRLAKAHERDINGINESLSTLHDETSNNTSTIGSLTTSVNELTAKVDTNTDSINGLTTKVNTNTDSINTINNTSIPHLQSEIDNLSAGGGSVDELRTQIDSINTEKIPSVENNVKVVAHETQRLAKAHDHDINGINESLSTLHDETSNNTSTIGSLTTSVNELTAKVDTNTSDISALSGKVDTNTSNIQVIKNSKWEKIIDQTSNGMHIEIYKANFLPLIEIYATLTFPQSIEGSTITMRIADGKQYAPWHITTAPVYLPHTYATGSGYLYAKYENNDLIVGFTLSGQELSGTGSATILYRY